MNTPSGDASSSFQRIDKETFCVAFGFNVDLTSCGGVGMWRQTFRKRLTFCLWLKFSQKTPKTPWQKNEVTCQPSNQLKHPFCLIDMNEVVSTLFQSEVIMKPKVIFAHFLCREFVESVSTRWLERSTYWIVLMTEKRFNWKLIQANVHRNWLKLKLLWFIWFRLKQVCFETMKSIIGI